MGLISQITTAVTGNTLTAAVWNDEFANIINAFNGNIENVNIKAGAAIAYSKLNLTGEILNADLAGSIAANKISGTAATLGGSETLTNKTLTTPTVNQAVQNKPTVNASVQTLKTNTYAGTVTFDMDVSSHHELVLTGGSTLAVTNVSAGQAFIIHLEQDGSGNRQVNWWAGIRWSGGSSPTLTVTGSKVDSLGFIKVGSEYYGYILAQNI